MDTDKKVAGNAATSQRKAVKVAGGLYLFYIIASILHFSMVEVHIVGAGNAAETANFIKANELLFRIGIFGDLIIFSSGLFLSIALYTILKVVNKNVALLAVLLRLLEVILGIVTELTSFIVLLLLKGGDYLNVFSTEQLQALVALFLNVRPHGFNLVIVFFSLGSILFYYLFFKSKYIPKLLSAWGMFTFVLMLICATLKILFPTYTSTFKMAGSIVTFAYMQAMLFQVIIGLWFLIKGINVKESAAVPTV
ncbi:MAG: DUF4386 domain-containing protein [bacterium]|nr:DUF4386 domain-containing protein [bacterium]